MTSLSRRKFLKLSVISLSASTLALSGCGGGGGGSGDTSPNVPSDNNASIIINPAFFPQSVVSGDPKTNSVILWTRVLDSEVSNDLAVRLQVATDSDFNQLVIDQADLPAGAAHDHCLKVKVTTLAAATVYYYRFLYFKQGVWQSTRTARTKTAPEENADTPVQFAVLSCQDYIGKYYNSLNKLLDLSPTPDFFIHVGDYIYETTGDPRFQTDNGERQISFDDLNGAIELTRANGDTFFAAQSVSNYRQLYKVYRQDPLLQQLHESMPMVSIWDDHEYSDDCYGIHANYSNGLQDEAQLQRRINSEQSYFEYMPIDDELIASTSAFTTANDRLFPNTQLYRSFRFGQHFQLLLTDYRSFRPDHLIPEGAYPGVIVMDRAAIQSTLAIDDEAYNQIKTNYDAYINLNTAPFATNQMLLISQLTQSYEEAGLDSASAQNKATQDLSANLSVTAYNNLATRVNESQGSEVITLIDNDLAATFDRGLSYRLLGKQDLFTEIGSRYLVDKEHFDLLSNYLNTTTDGASENVFGVEQQSWLDNEILQSNATFLGVGSSVSTATLIADFTNRLLLPREFRRAYYLNLDQWDGFPNKRAEMLTQLSQRNGVGSLANTFLFSGDIHSSFIMDHDGLVDFTTPSVSSSTFASLVENILSRLPSAVFDLVLRQLINIVNQGLTDANPNLKLADSSNNGFILINVNATQVETTYYLLPAENVSNNLYQDPDLTNQFSSHTFVYSGIDNSVVEVT